MKTEKEFALREFLFGSVGKKLGWAFGVLFALLILNVALTYNLTSKIQDDSIALKNVEAPLNVMVEQVIGYDAILTGNAHASLLHAIKNLEEGIAEHKAEYDEAGVELDNLLKYKARDLINKSKRNQEDKDKVYEYLNELDKVNLALVDLEIGAFEAMEKGDIERAYSLIVSEEYHEYKKELADLYKKLESVEAKVAEEYRQRVLKNTRNVLIYNIILGIIFILIAGVIPFFVRNYLYLPMQKIISTAEEIRKGNFKARAEVKTHDEIRTLGETLNKTAEALQNLEESREQIDKAKTEFLSITSHELRSPMTPMVAQLQMILGNYFGKLNSEQRKSLDIVLDNTKRLDKIIVDFLEISRIEAARLKFNFVKTNLEKNVKNLKQEMDSFLAEKNIKINLEMDSLPVFECDPDRTMQVLRNLITNAKKYSKPNSQIVVKVKARKEDVLFSVQDFGVGISEKNQLRIFEPFFQEENMYQHKSGGAGLGLAISKGIVESQNGKIGFESKEGKGTTFFFNLPYKPTKEMKSIKLLFSPKADVEKELKETMLEYLGPIAEIEFEDLKARGLAEAEILKYIDELKKQKILQHTEEFKNKVRMLFKREREGKIK